MARQGKSQLKSTEENLGPNILTLIKQQHEILRESIEVLKSEDAEDAKKQSHLARFIPILKMHSEAEEQTIYPVLREVHDEETEMVTLEAYTEHALAKSLVEELETSGFQYSWTPEIAAKAKVLAELVEHHAEEEEDEFFDMARENLFEIELQSLGAEFLAKCREILPEWSAAPGPRQRRIALSESPQL